MVSIDVRQAALVAISKGWYLSSNTGGSFPFSPAELAIAAGLYEGIIEPAAQDDVTHGLKVIIDHLPQECDTFFTKAKAYCPNCGASTTGWVDFAQRRCLQCCTPLGSSWRVLARTPMSTTGDYFHHRHTWSMDIPRFRPLSRLSTTEQNANFFPPIASVRSILTDASLQEESIEITGFVCSDVSEWPNAHYWLAEVRNGQIQGTYDSLKGLQQLTTDVWKKLRVTGLLLCKTTVTAPKMSSCLLDETAGIIPPVNRLTRPIKVQCRQKVITLRKFLKQCDDKSARKRRVPNRAILSPSRSSKRPTYSRTTKAKKPRRAVIRKATVLPHVSSSVDEVSERKVWDGTDKLLPLAHWGKGTIPWIRSESLPFLLS